MFQPLLIVVVVMTVGDVMVTVRWVVVQDAHCSSASPSVSGFGGTETEPAPTINHHDPHCKILISASPHCIDKLLPVIRSEHVRTFSDSPQSQESQSEDNLQCFGDF